MAEDRVKLLRSLAIDRGEAEQPPPAPQRSWSKPMVLGVVVLAALAAGLWLLVTQPGIDGQVERRAAPAAERTGALPSAPAPATETRQAGGLAASGYVVARRKA